MSSPLTTSHATPGKLAILVLTYEDTTSPTPHGSRTTHLLHNSPIHPVRDLISALGKAISSLAMLNSCCHTTRQPMPRAIRHSHRPPFNHSTGQRMRTTQIIHGAFDLFSLFAQATNAHHAFVPSNNTCRGNKKTNTHAFTSHRAQKISNHRCFGSLTIPFLNSPSTCQILHFLLTANWASVLSHGSKVHHHRRTDYQKSTIFVAKSAPTLSL